MISAAAPTCNYERDALPTLGQGKWGVMGMAMQETNFGNSWANNLTTIGGYVAYGAMDKLDLYLTAGNAFEGGLASGITQSIGSLGLTAKYQLMAENADFREF